MRKNILDNGAFFGFASGLLSVHQNFFYQSISLSSVSIGMISMFGAVATMGLALPAGNFAKCIGYYPVCIIGGILQGVGLLLTGLVLSPWASYVGFFIYSIGLTFIHAVEFPYLVNMVEPNHKSSAYFYLILVFSLSSVMGSLAGQWMNFITVPWLNPYQLSMIISAIGFFLFSVFRFHLPNIHPISSSVPFETSKTSYLQLIKKPPILAFLGYKLFFSISLSLLGSQLNIVYREVFNFSDLLVSKLYSISTLLTLITLIVFPNIIRKKSSDKVSSAILLTMVFVFALSILGNSYLFVMMMMIRSALSQVFPVVIESRMLVALPQHYQAGYASLRVLIASLGQGIGSLLTGYFLTYLDFRYMMIAGFFVMIITAILFLRKCKPHMNLLQAF
ncbi:MAG: MFS transporter [Clostridiales bacterium]|nr:MFS transporter [Clostridiales bacterium]